MVANKNMKRKNGGGKGRGNLGGRHGSGMFRNAQFQQFQQNPIPNPGFLDFSSDSEPMPMAIPQNINNKAQTNGNINRNNGNNKKFQGNKQNKQKRNGGGGGAGNKMNLPGRPGNFPMRRPPVFMPPLEPPHGMGPGMGPPFPPGPPGAFRRPPMPPMMPGGPMPGGGGVGPRRLPIGGAGPIPPIPPFINRGGPGPMFPPGPAAMLMPPRRRQGAITKPLVNVKNGNNKNNKKGKVGQNKKKGNKNQAPQYTMDKPWVNDEIKEAHAKKIDLENRLKGNRNDELFAEYKKQRDLFVKLYDEAKLEYIGKNKKEVNTFFRAKQNRNLTCTLKKRSLFSSHSL